MLMASGSQQDGLHVYVNRKVHAVNNQCEGSKVKKVSVSSAVKKSRKGICEIINPTPGLVYPTVDIREDIDMHFSSTRDFHTTDRSTRACSNVDGIVPEADDANDVVIPSVDANDVVNATVDISEARGCPFWMMAGNE
ncbi:hypothetical protein MRB53_010396 [Persea americana]|uniref:Uncharacterized protein n=1 Tax=Persea americana TaxID=3435 RepID=A0ACC2LRR3_PERAE|nr:hypothetical protein MRB53_010396 [Persea americana]